MTQSEDDMVLMDVQQLNEMRRLYPLMVQLRPHLSEDAFLTRWQRQAAAGYKVIALFKHTQAHALAGYRIQENFVHGRFLYIDDLVTERTLRSQGYGRKLIEHLRQHAQELGCEKLVLDTPMSNSLGHRFYFRCGMLAKAFRFSIEV